LKIISDQIDALLLEVINFHYKICLIKADLSFPGQHKIMIVINEIFTFSLEKKYLEMSNLEIHSPKQNMKRFNFSIFYCFIISGSEAL
jgi:hypothetical protein